jgi:hypothetical protein
MTSVRVQFGAAAVVVTVAVSACSATVDSTGTPSQAPATVAKAPTLRPSCEAPFPAAWQKAIDASGVDTGGVSTVPLAVGRAGEVAAVRDNGDTRDVLLINTDKSVHEIYAVLEPNRNNAGFVAMDDRWIVVGVDRIPRNSNGVLPGLIRVEVIDRQNDSVRMVTERSDADYATGANSLDSVALYDGKVYWITHTTYAGNAGVLRSYDPGTGAVADVEEGPMRSLRATAAGLVADVESGDTGRRLEVKMAAELPAPVADASTGPDRVSLTTDGTAYAWITGVDRGGSGVAWWSPAGGLVRIAGDFLGLAGAVPPVFVVGPYVFIGKGRGGIAGPDTYATVVDTRSGAVTYAPVRAKVRTDLLAGADGATIALLLRAAPGKGGYLAGVVRSDALPPVFC